MDEKPRYFKTPGEDGLVTPLGMAIDDDRGRLYVCNLLKVDIYQVSIEANLLVFDIVTSELLATLEFTDGEVHFLNDVTVDKSTGKVYINDAFRPFIYTTGPDLRPLEVLVEHPLLSPYPPYMTGLDVTPDGRFIIASVTGWGSSATPSDGALRRVSLDTK